jgi:hypothetical protein
MLPQQQTFFPCGRIKEKSCQSIHLCVCLCDVVGRRIYTLINACTTFVREIYNGTLKKSVFKYVPTNPITQFSICHFWPSIPKNLQLIIWQKSLQQTIIKP